MLWWRVNKKISEKSGFAKDYIKEQGEYTPGRNWFESLLLENDFYGHFNQSVLWNVQKNTILDIAKKESCVIVGRCADYILKDVANCLTVFIHASMENRMERIVKIYGEYEDASPKKRLMDKDKKRKTYYQFYTDTEWGVAKNYHIALDSGVLGIEKCVEIIAGLYW